jgi:hypothetical protein
MGTENKSLVVQGVEIHVTSKGHDDYLSLTDMVKAFDGGAALIDSWLRNKNTVEFLGVWETLNNPAFNSLEFEGIRSEAGANRFTLSAKKWVQRTGSIGVIAKAGRYGGTFAHKDIAFEFGSWLSPEFKLYLIKEFQRLKESENNAGQLEWNIRRELSKAQYRVHTDAVKEHLIPPSLTREQQGYVYASEADMLNKALFGKTTREWKAQNPERQGTIRDYATVEQLVVLSTLESQNALLIGLGHSQADRLKLLNETAIKQLRSIAQSLSIQKLSNKPLLK